MALDAKIIEEHGYGPIGVERNMCCFMNREVVAGTLADNVESVDERHISLPILEGHLKARLRNPSRLILKTGRLASTADALRLKMHITTDIVAVDCLVNQRV